MRPQLSPAEYEQIARDYFDVRSRSGDELVCICPFHGDTTPSLWFNLNSGLWYCFSCHERGNHLAISNGRSGVDEDDELRALMEVLGPERPMKCKCLELYEQVRNTSDLREDLMFDRFSESAATIAGRSRRALPEPSPSLRFFTGPGVCEVCSRPHLLSEDYLNDFKSAPERTSDYWTDHRGLHQETITMYGLGYDLLRKSATIPVRSHEGFLLGVIRRRMAGRPKYLNPPNFPKSTTLFGSHLIGESKWVVLCEGPVDTMKVAQSGLPAVGMYGSSLSYDQVNLLHYLGIQGVVVFTDAEDEGREADRQACRRLSESDLFVRSVDWGRRRKGDPGGLQRSQIRGLVQRSKWINPPA